MAKRRGRRRYRTTQRQRAASRRNLYIARKKRNRRLAIGSAAGVLAVSVGAAVIYGKKTGSLKSTPGGTMTPAKAKMRNIIIGNRKMKRVLVTGSRNWSDAGTIHSALNEQKAMFGDIIVVHGGAKGADSIAEAWGKANKVKTEVHPADWNKHGRAAGPIRNKEMLDTGIDVVVAFPLGKSPGTRGMMKIARNAGVKVRDYTK